MNPADINWLPPWEMSSAVSSRKALLAPVTMVAAMMRWRWNRSHSSQTHAVQCVAPAWGSGDGTGNIDSIIGGIIGIA